MRITAKLANTFLSTSSPVGRASVERRKTAKLNSTVAPAAKRYKDMNTIIKSFCAMFSAQLRTGYSDFRASNPEWEMWSGSNGQGSNLQER